MLLLHNIGVMAGHAPDSLIPQTSELLTAAPMIAIQNLCILWESPRVFEILAGVGGLYNVLDLPRIPVQKMIAVRALPISQCQC